MNGNILQHNNDGKRNIINFNETRIFQPKLMINERLTRQFDSVYINALREALFTHFEKSYETSNIPYMVCEDGNNVLKYICGQCKDR